MLGLMDNLSSENLVLICFILGTIALALAIAISIEIYVGNKKYREMHKNNLVIDSDIDRLNIKEDTNVKYVEEMDKELEKTKAKVELQELREKLKKEEEEKQKLIDTNLALAGAVSNNSVVLENKDEIERLEDTLVNMKIIKENNIANQEINEVSTKKENIQYNDENEAIISYEELKNVKNNNYVDQEVTNYVDEKDAIISIKELEKLYNESQSIEVAYEGKNNNSSNNNEYQTSSYVSPIYGQAKTDQDLVLEQTANLEKLNEEIRKTNEFLKMLKDLKKNLE